MSVTTGLVIVGVLAMVYGIGFAVLPMHHWPQEQRSRYTVWGSGLIGMLALALVVIPWFIRG